MPYSLPNATQLKIHGYEIRDAMGFEKSWLAGVCLFLQCLTASDVSGLSQLLDQVDEHNQLVSAIEIDLRQANAASQANDALQDLSGVVKTFSQTKQKIFKALAQQSDQSNRASTYATNYIIHSMGGDATKLQNVYGGLIRKSHSLGIRAQESISVHKAFASSTGDRAITRGYHQQLQGEKRTSSSLNGTLSTSIHGWARP